MLIVASENGLEAIGTGWDVLASGGSAVDAAEACARVVEADPDDHTVGYSGYPNLLGEVELDASIMDGTSRQAGAVAALRGYRHAITVARAVMDRLPHVLVAGEGAARLAAEIGMQAEDLLTPEAEATWREGLQGRAEPGSLADLLLSRMAAATGRESSGRAREVVLSGLVDLATDPDHVAGTVDFIAVDREGRLASAVSTSGWAWKYPGRVGDSPIIGAGNYADSRYGAAACTGHGELAIRAGTARTIVADLAAGRSLQDAMDAAVHDLATLGMRPETITMRVVAVDREGNHDAVGTTPGLTYAYREAGMDGAVLAPRRHVVPGAG
ncbi:MAG TPA: N(4)-(beta-N-acetylglucosaminyl)-L-asparaginase [Nitriliruptorales bacterium]